MRVDDVEHREHPPERAAEVLGVDARERLVVGALVDAARVGALALARRDVLERAGARRVDAVGHAHDDDADAVRLAELYPLALRLEVGALQRAQRAARAALCAREALVVLVDELDEADDL